MNKFKNILEKVKDIIERVKDILMIFFIFGILFYELVILEMIVKKIYIKYKINKIKKNLDKGINKKDLEFLEKEIKKIYDEKYVDMVLKQKNGRNLLPRFEKMKSSFVNDTLNENDLKIIKYLNGVEKFENIKMSNMGIIVFKADKMEEDIIEYTIENHFFMKKWLELHEHKIIINDWQREIDDLVDLVYFIHKKCKLTYFNIKLSYINKDYDELNFENGKVYKYLKGKKVKEFDNEVKKRISLYEYEKNDKRYIIINNKKYPYISEFMKVKNRSKNGKYKDLENKYYCNGEMKPSCHDCVFRMKQLVEGGCIICDPKNI